MINRPAKPNPYGIRTANPTAWPQYPYNETPQTPERSHARYTIQNEWNQAIAVRDGTKLLLDVYRPAMMGERFPALVSFSPYTRQLQRDSAPIGQNEAGISEFWVPRGYAHVIVDVRGTNGSGGSWDMMGPDEQTDMADIIEWVAEQPWCDGNVGMMGCSYFAMTQNLAAEQQPPSLKAIFPYDACTDLYRDFYFSGGIPHDGFQRIWFSDITFLNFWGGRNPNTAGLTKQFQTILGLDYPLDGEFYWKRSAWPSLSKIQVPAYFGCHWSFYNLHLRGTFEAWVGTGDITKRMILGPDPLPQRQYANYHMEALRWYDHFLKGMDTQVLDGAPVHLWIQGDEAWRDEHEWPLARTQWTEFHLGGTVGSGSLTDTTPPDGEQTLEYNPNDEQQWLRGEPRWIYRSEPLDSPLEVTGPIQLNLVMASTAEDTDWIVIFQDEAPDGSIRELTRGWLRSSHRAVDPERSGVNEPWHPHDRVDLLTPNQQELLPIDIRPTCNVFGKGHRIRLELSNCDSIVTNNFWFKRTHPWPATNTIVQGPGQSHLILPVIPR
jgi:hypothetical protein